MGEIVKYLDKEIEAIDKLEVGSKPYILALIAPKIVEMVKVDAGNGIYDIIKRAEFDSGLTKLHNDDLIVLAKSSYDLIQDSYPNLTMEEFKIACKNGALNNYGDWYGMCLKTIVFWIKGYLKTEGRAKAIKEWNAKIDYKSSNVPVAAILEFTKQGALNAFERYKAHKILPIGAFAYYDVINDLIGQDYNGTKTLITDPKIRGKIKADVKFKYLSVSLKERKIAEQQGDYQTTEKLMNGILEGFRGTMDHALKTEFLKAFFDQLIKENKQLKL